MYQVFGTWMSLATCSLHRLDDARRTVAEQVAAPAGEEVEVAVALGVPDVRALAAHQADRVARVVADDVLLEQVDGLLDGHECVSVACSLASAAESSASHADAANAEPLAAIDQHDLRADAAVGVDLQQQRMSQPAVDDVRLADAAAQAVEAGLDLGDHALVDDACGDQLAGSRRRRGCGSASPGRRRSRRMPGVSVRKTSFSACRWAATAAAAVSALTFSQPPSASIASDGITGTTPAAQKSRIRSASTRVTVPTRPRSTGCAVGARQRQLFAEQVLQRAEVQPDGPAAELADLPHDVGVDLLAAARGRRWRAWRRRCSGGPGPCAACRPAAAMARSIGLPPPWTRTGRRPTVSMKTTSCSVARRASGSSMALPPSLMTVSWSRNCADVAEGLDQHVGLADGVVHLGWDVPGGRLKD